MDLFGDQDCTTADQCLHLRSGVRATREALHPRRAE